MDSLIDERQIPWSNLKSFWFNEDSDFENSLFDTETLQVL